LALAVAGADADGAQLEVDVTPAQREQLAHPQARKGRGLKDGTVLR
jgi:hypothetical protein